MLVFLPPSVAAARVRPATSMRDLGVCQAAMRCLFVEAISSVPIPHCSGISCVAGKPLALANVRVHGRDRDQSGHNDSMTGEACTRVTSA
jgi:threonine/homoserine efflux transporter RhtA